MTADEHHWERLHVVEGFIRAIENWPDVATAIWNAPGRAAAQDVLQSPPFDFLQVVALHILDMPCGRLTQHGRDALDDEYRQLRLITGETDSA